MNPFSYGGVVSGEQFCNRISEIRELAGDVESGQNVLIYAPRRFGKSSLVRETLQGVSRPAVFFDFMGCVDEEEFLSRYFRAVCRAMERSSDKLVRLLKQTFHFRPSVSAGFDDSGSASFTLDLIPAQRDVAFEDVMELPRRFAEHRKQGVVVVFDEFQEVLRLGLAEKIRSVIQNHAHHVCYIFLGSKKSVIKGLFLDPTKALYRSVKHFPLKGIEREAWSAFVQERFTSEKREISPEAIDGILSVSQGFPYYTQQLAYELFALGSKRSGPDEVARAVGAVLDKEQDLFLSEWERLSGNQKRALRLVVDSGPRELYAREKLRTHGLTASALKKALEGLLAKDVIDRDGEHWFVQDPLFSFFVRRRL